MNLSTWQIWHFQWRSKPRKTGVLRWRTTAAGPRKSGLHQENPNWGIPPRKNTSDTHETYTMQKAYSPMHSYAWPTFGNFGPFQIFVWGLVGSRFGHMVRTDPKGHP